jgi:hypothetical protein
MSDEKPSTFDAREVAILAYHAFLGPVRGTVHAVPFEIEDSILHEQRERTFDELPNELQAAFSNTALVMIRWANLTATQRSELREFAYAMTRSDYLDNK